MRRIAVAALAAGFAAGALAAGQAPAPKLSADEIVEKAKAYGTFGAHGLGEPPMGPAAPAIVNAVYNAVGAWITDMPLTRDKLLAALKGS